MSATGIVDAKVAFQAPARIGPRHLALLPGRNRALLVYEPGARLLLLRREGEGFVCVDDFTTALEPRDDNLGGHLDVSLDAIHVTNRRHDSLVRLAMEGDRLVPQAW